MTHLLDEPRSKASTSMRRKHIDFREMRGSGVDDLDVRKSNGRVSRQRNPQVSLAHGLLKDGVACRLTQNRFRRVATQKPRGGQLDFRDLTDVLWPRPNDRVGADARRLTARDAAERTSPTPPVADPMRYLLHPIPFHSELR